MKRVRREGTTPELRVAQTIRWLGFRPKSNARGLPGSPDLVVSRRQLAVFVHGCFWHHHKGCRRATVPKRNREFWLEKLKANMRRDARKARALRKLGFAVLTIWECQVESVSTGRRLARYLKEEQ